MTILYKQVLERNLMSNYQKWEAELNALYYLNDNNKYQAKLDEIKYMGFKVYRNSSGLHKIKQSENYINEVFGGIFGEIFRGGD